MITTLLVKECSKRVDHACEKCKYTKACDRLSEKIRNKTGLDVLPYELPEFTAFLFKTLLGEI